MSSVTDFGSLPDGTPVTLYTLQHGNIEATFLDYGARLVSLKLTDSTGAVADVVLGYDSLDLYLADKTYCGAVVGRFGNRIANGTFALDGITYRVPQNDNTNALHGGPVGFDQKLWKTSEISDGLEMTLVSPYGDQGFPGTLTVTVRYTLTAHGLQLDYTATTDKPTVVNVTNHAYFNLAGESLDGSAATILDHEITIPAASFTPVTDELVPTGELAPVDSTIFDFRQSARIGDHIEDDNIQIHRGHGWDHNWVLGSPGQMKLAAIVRDPVSGRTMTASTTEPGIQFYSGNFIDGTMPNRTGGLYPRRAGLCLETQHYPDSPNHPEFPSTVLRPGETMHSTTLFSFGTE
jgi:aldose 1-epimerase